jgi:RNA polymerase sigma-70 factor (ECF subfamily)
MHDWTEPELVTSASRGNHDAFAELTRRSYRRCFNIAFSVLRNREDAEDQTQNAFSRAFTFIGSLQGGMHFRSWVTRILLNECYMLIRSRKMKSTALDNVLESELLRQGRIAFPDPESEFARTEMRLAVRTHTNRLPPLLREPIVLRYLAEMPVSQIAQKLGVSIMAAKSRLVRARKELGLRLEQHHVINA